ncbi:Alpha/beta hydrolase family protein [Prosthecobacter debontii]|uniref:Alpha/beta hydrolase family protein n=1 Tax=Prosthecobacter debontii TaxID=48467 RepID=A0A1T4WFJ4_9BACT|nr:dienelactone hydrolase family protein [Prosthecobacter debontii]SKA75421.1 Alpha/beta hydrolase family protein [Prosthecobacter debontii]
MKRSHFLASLAVFLPCLLHAETPRATKPPEKFVLRGERWTCVVDGDEVSGILLKPAGKGPFPAVLISHGKGGSATSFGRQKAREMVAWGMVCIAPDYTHASSAMRGNPQSSSDQGASDKNIRRARACIQILQSLPEVDPQRISAYGHSVGGFVTIGLAALEPRLIKAAAITGSGLAPRDGYPAPSVEAAEKILTPFLMLHGMDDNVVRPEQSEMLKKVLDQQKVPNDRLVADGQGHPIDQTMRTEVFKLIRDWFTQHEVLKKP